MQITSPEWNDIYTRDFIENESLLEVVLSVVDDDLQQTATGKTFDAPPHVEFSNPLSLPEYTDISVPRYGTMEENRWILDGTIKTLGDTVEGDSRYISNSMWNGESWNNGEPTIGLQFSQRVRGEVAGITITWSSTFNEFPRNFTIQFYTLNGQTMVDTDSVVVTNNTEVARYVMTNHGNDFDGFRVIVHDWCLPNQRARAESLAVGLFVNFGKKDILSYDSTQEYGILGEIVPRFTCSFGVDNRNGRFNPDEDNNIAEYLKEKMKIHARYGLLLDNGIIEWINGGTFYLSAWDFPQGGLEARFEGADLFHYMSGTFNKISPLNPVPITTYFNELYTAIKQAMPEANIVFEPVYSFDTKADLNGSFIDCLQWLAQATCSNIYLDRNSTDIYIGHRDSDEVDVSMSKLTAYPQSTLDKPCSDIQVKYTEFVAGSSSNENSDTHVTQKLVVNNTPQTPNILDITVSTDNYIRPLPANWPLTFGRGVIVDMSADSIGFGDGGAVTATILDSHNIRLEIPNIGSFTGIPVSSGDITVFGDQYVLTDKVFSLPVSLSANGDTLEVKNPLITTQAHASAIANWIKGIIAKRQTVKYSMLANPVIDTADTIRTGYHIAEVDEYGNLTGNTKLFESNARASLVKYTFSGTFRAEVEGRNV